MELKDLTLRELLTIVFEWAYKNDTQLYRNLDDHFSAFDCRNSISHDRQEMVRGFRQDGDLDPLPLLFLAINKADFHDTLRFTWSFITGGGRNRLDDYVYDRNTPHSYVSLFPVIEERMVYLKSKKLDDWHKSEDHGKHQHFRYWINKFLSDDKYYHLRLLVENDTRCFQILDLGSKEDESFKNILSYILENNICPDVHRQSLEVQDFINPDYFNERKITTSGRAHGFRYFVYLTASELKEIYDTKIIKRKLDYFDKANWSFIKEMEKGDEKTRFYLFIS